MVRSPRRPVSRGTIGRLQPALLGRVNERGGRLPNGDCSPGADPCRETRGIIIETFEDTGDCPECVEDGLLLLMELN